MNTPHETPVTRRFLRCQWTPLRLAMDAMTHDEVLTLPRGRKGRGSGGWDYNTSLVHARRLREAYDGQRQWVVRLTTCKTRFTILHTQPATP